MLSRPDGTLVLVDSYSRLVDVTTDFNVGVELSVVCESFVVADRKTLVFHSLVRTSICFQKLSTPLPLAMLKSFSTRETGNNTLQ